MRVYLNSKQLGDAVRDVLEKRAETQKKAAANIGVTQGALGNFLAGRFKTENAFVQVVCKYANLNPRDFLLESRTVEPPSNEMLVALNRVCGGAHAKQRAVLRILHALEDLG